MYRIRNVTQHHLDLASFRPAGAWIPHQWTEKLRTDADRPWPFAALVLSEIIFWNTPVVSLDKEGRQVYYKRYKGSAYQADYQQIADHWGLSKRTVRRCVDYLVSQGLVTRELRSIRIASGQVLTNLPFLTPIMPAVRELTYDKSDTAVEARLYREDEDPTPKKPGLDDTLEDLKPGQMRPSSDLLKPGQMRPDIPHNTNTYNTIKDPAGVPAEPKGKPLVEVFQEQDHQKAMRLYQDALGYAIPNGAQTGAGIKKLLKSGYTPDQMIACYHWLKGQPFWKDKLVTVQTIHKNIGEYLKGQGPDGPQLDKAKIKSVNQLAMEQLEKL